jgi:hypothetical protein
MTEAFYLQCSREFDKVAKLGSLAGDPEILSKKGSEEARSATRVGWYSHVDGRLVCLCRLDGVPWLRIKDFVIRVDDDVHVFWDLTAPPRQQGPQATSRTLKPGKVTVSPSVRATFRVEKAGQVILSFEHRPFQDMTIFVGDLTPFVTEEDYDFMLLISRVLEEPGRRASFFAPRSPEQRFRAGVRFRPRAAMPRRRCSPSAPARRRVCAPCHATLFVIAIAYSSGSLDVSLPAQRRPGVATAACPYFLRSRP